MMYKQVIDISYCYIPHRCLYFTSSPALSQALVPPVLPLCHPGVGFHTGRYGEPDCGCIFSTPVALGQIKPCLVIHIAVNITA